MSRRIAIIIELEVDDDSITGQVKTLPGAATREFCGWITLISALDELIKEPACSR